MSTEPTGHRYERDGDIVTVVIDHGPINIVDPELIESMITHLPTVLDDPTVRCVVVRGKDRIFVGGANLRVMQRLDPDTYRDMRRWVVVQRLLELAPKPVIAALNGHALGGGAELSLACDLRILHAKAMFGFPETDLGIFPGAGGSQRLPRLVGAHRAKRFIIDATKFTAEQALREGLVDVVAGDDFEDVVAREARRLADRPTATIGLVKSVIDRGLHLPIDEAMAVEEQDVMANLELRDAAEGIGSFLDKRAAQFEGR
ncbi:enoyl-CoA hydratase/isomerase family protein [Rhodococcoides fascians]|uniref:enoyl-CoA hydratase/isomerase family protein n=1 Tax=Rhodococcoides fascians TaxID=1828 RepID=UPI0038998E03